MIQLLLLNPSLIIFFKYSFNCQFQEYKLKFVDSFHIFLGNRKLCLLILKSVGQNNQKSIIVVCLKANRI